MTRLIARFAVDGWDVRSVEGVSTGAEDDWVGVASMHKTFTSGLAGTSTVLFVSSGVEGSGPTSRPSGSPPRWAVRASRAA